MLTLYVSARRCSFFVITYSRRLADDIKEYALKNGPAYAHPRHVWFVDEIALASTAKIDRTQLIKNAEKLLNLDTEVQ